RGQALLRAGARRSHRPARQARRNAGAVAWRGAGVPVDRITAAVGLGSNLGDRRAHLDHAVSKLQHLLAGLKVSRYYDTKAEGVSGPQPMFLNAAAVGQTTLSARALLERLFAIEDEQGRDRPYVNAPRSLDLDLILVGD